MRSLIAIIAALLISITLAAPAEAGYISRHTWNRLAYCESGGRWHINTGNGYYGGLQFSLSTWRAYRSPWMARYPHHARKWVQIRVGHRVQHAQGWGAWPVCSRRIGVR